MARPETISRLHAPVKNDNLAHLQPEPEQVKTTNFVGLEIDVSAASMLELQERSLVATPVRARFVFEGRREPEAGGSPDLMSSVQPGVPLDRSGAFAVMAARDRMIRAWQTRHAQREGAIQV